MSHHLLTLDGCRDRYRQTMTVGEMLCPMTMSAGRRWFVFLTSTTTSVALTYRLISLDTYRNDDLYRQTCSPTL